MKPFTYVAPTSVNDATALLAQTDKCVRPLAGGTDLLVQLRRGLFDVDVLVDVKRIPDLSQITYDPAAGLVFGAAVTCAELCECEAVRAHYPGLVDAAAIIGGPAIQGRATVGGNLCNAAPSGDAIPALIVLGAAAMVTGVEETRLVPVETFCTAPGQTVLQPGDLLVSLHLPPPHLRSGASYARFTPRAEMDIAVAGAGAWLQLSEDGTKVVDVRIALAAVAPTPLLVASAGAALVGQAPTEVTFSKAAALAQQAACPIDDVRGSAAQRQHLVGVLVLRALRQALARAQAHTK